MTDVLFLSRSPLHVVKESVQSVLILTNEK